MKREKMTIKERLHQLIEELPDRELPAAQRFLEYLRNCGDPVLRAFLEAPEDDEPETPEEAAAVQEALEELAKGETVPWDEARRRLLGTE